MTFKGSKPAKIREALPLDNTGMIINSEKSRSLRFPKQWLHRMRNNHNVGIPCCFPILRYQKSTGKTCWREGLRTKKQIEIQRYRSVPLWIKKSDQETTGKICTVQECRFYQIRMEMDDSFFCEKFRIYDSGSFHGRPDSGIVSGWSCDRFQKIYLAFQCKLPIWSLIRQPGSHVIGNLDAKVWLWQKVL